MYGVWFIRACGSREDLFSVYFARQTLTPATLINSPTDWGVGGAVGWGDDKRNTQDRAKNPEFKLSEAISPIFVFCQLNDDERVYLRFCGVTSGAEGAAGGDRALSISVMVI